MPTLIGSTTLQNNWTPSGETTTGVLLFQSILEQNQNDCQFLVRLKYGLNGLETPIYTETKGVFLEPGSSSLIDFRSLVPDSFSFNDPDIRWIIETRLGFNFSPITVKIQEFDSLSFENELTLAALNAKAEKIHNHQESDITGLTQKLSSFLIKPSVSPQPGQVLKSIDPETVQWSDLNIPAPQEIPLVSWENDGLAPKSFAGIEDIDTEGTHIVIRSGGEFQGLSLATFTMPTTYQTIINNANLYTGGNFIARTGVREVNLPAVNGSGLKIFNASDSNLLVKASTSSGIFAYVNGELTINNAASVRIKPGMEATFTNRDSSQWQAFGVHQAPVTFGMIANAPSLINSAWITFDLFHWIENRHAQTTPINPAGTSNLEVFQSSTASGWGSASVLSDRSNAPTTQARNAKTNSEAGNYWLWFMPTNWRFQLTGIAIQSQGFSNSFHPRSIRAWCRVYQTKSEAIAGARTGTFPVSVTSTTTGSNNLSVVTTQNQWHFMSGFSSSSILDGNAICFFHDGANSTTNDLSLCLQRICFYGSLTTD